MNKFFLLISLFLLNIQFLLGYSFQGRILNQSGQPVADVYVLIEKTSFYAISQQDGRFHITNVPAGIYDISFGHVSYNNFLLENITIQEYLILKEPVILMAKLHQLETTVITAARHTESVTKSPEAINSIKATTIRQREVKNPAEALREEGVAVQKTGHGGGSAILRGLSSNRILILVDGVRLNNALFRLGNHQYLTTVDANTLERMEVVCGPGSVLFGSDALGGTINLITSTADSFPAASQIHLKAFTRFASADAEKTLAGQMDWRNQYWAVRAGFSAKSMGDLQRGSYNLFKHPQHTGASLLQSPSGFEGYDFNTNLAYKLDSEHKFIFTFQRSRRFNVPRYDKYENNDYELWHYHPQERDLAYLRHVWTPCLPWLCRLKTTVSLQRQGEGRKMRPREQSAQTNEYDSVLSRGLQISAFSGFERCKISYGLDIYSDIINSERFLVQAGSRIKQKQQIARYPDGAIYNSAGLYAMYSYEMSDKLMLNAGLRYSLINTKFDLADSILNKVNLDFRALTASIGMVYNWNSHWSFKARIAQGFRAPNLSDLAKFGQSKGSTFEIPNTHLQPEKLLSFETGLHYVSATLNLQGTVFYSRIYDILESVAATYNGSSTIERQGEIFTIKTKDNFGKAYIRGLELDVNYSVANGMSLRGQFTSTFGKNISARQPMSKIPPAFGLLGLEWQKRKWRLEFFSRFAFRQDRLSADDLDDPRIPAGGTPQWFTLNARSSYNLNHYLKLHFSVENIPDLNYREHASGINAPGRNFIISVDLLL